MLDNVSLRLNKPENPLAVILADLCGSAEDVVGADGAEIVLDFWIFGKNTRLDEVGSLTFILTSHSIHYEGSLSWLT